MSDQLDLAALRESVRGARALRGAGGNAVASIPLDTLETLLAAAERDELHAELAKWKGAIIDAAVVGWTYREAHENDPKAAVNALLVQAQREALDPAVSPDAKALHDRIAALQAEVERLRAQIEHITAPLRCGDGCQQDTYEERVYQALQRYCAALSPAPALAAKEVGDAP